MSITIPLLTDVLQRLCERVDEEILPILSTAQITLISEVKNVMSAKGIKFDSNDEFISSKCILDQAIKHI